MDRARFRAGGRRGAPLSALRDCAEHGVPLAPPLPGGGSAVAGPARRDRRGRRDLRARKPQGRAEPEPQATPTRRQGAQARPVARAGADPGRRRSWRRDPQPHPAEARRGQREAGAGASDRPGRPARLRRRSLPSPRRRGARHSRESVNRSAGERVRGAVHIQTVNSRHSQIKGFLRRFRGIATKYLDSYLRWFHLVVLGRHPSPRACLAAASVRTCLRFAN